MNRYLVFTAIIIMITILAGNAYASGPSGKASIEHGEMNLIESLESSNYGVRTSAAQILGDIKSTKAVIPLMRMLKSSDDEKTRIVAALALYKIGSNIGIFSVAQAAKFDDSKRVRKLCQNFYNEYNVKEMDRITDINPESDYAIAK